MLYHTILNNTQHSSQILAHFTFSWTLLLLWLTILSHTTLIFYPLLSLYIIISPPTNSLLSRSNSQSFPTLLYQESYLLSTLSKKWLVGWNITVNTIHTQRISYLFSTGWHFKYHRIHSRCIKPLCLPPPTAHKKD